MRSPTVIILLITTTPITPIHASPSQNDNKAHLRTISWYRRKPHDTSLYDVLNVSYDASPGEIAKSYKRLSLEWHPDKLRRKKSKEERKITRNIISSNMPPPPPPPPRDKDLEVYASDKLAQISNAYEILSNDQTRLLYHRYGIKNGIEGAVQLLTGKVRHSSASDDIGSDDQLRLLQLMGYPSHLAHHGKEARVCYLTSTIIEKLRPLVEDTVSQEMYVQSVYDDCIALSKSGLGKQILRCVGRAYRREGYRVLRTMNRNKSDHGLNISKQNRHSHKMADVLRDSWSTMQHLASAVLATGKLALVETKLKQLHKKKERIRSRRTADTNMVTMGDRSNISDSAFMESIGILPDDAVESMFSDDEGELPEELDDAHFKHLADEKTYNALLTSHQTDVLWKLSKIDLDSTIRKACRQILLPTNEGWCSFFPSQNSPYPNDWGMSHYSSMQQDGWVGQDGNAISMEVGRLRAAAALVLVGDIMVRCGKGYSERHKSS